MITSKQINAFVTSEGNSDILFELKPKNKRDNYIFIYCEIIWIVSQEKEKWSNGK